MAQGNNKTGTKGTNSIFVMSHDEIDNIPADWIVTYARIVVDFLPHKEDPNRVRMIAGGNLINYPGDLTNRTVDLITSKVLWNSVLSTEDSKFMELGIGNFYLVTPMDWYEYMKITLSIFPQHIIDQYYLQSKVRNGHLYH